MRKLFAIAWIDIRIEFSERSTLVFFFILPIIFTLVIGLGLQNLYGNTDPNADPRYVLLVVDEDNTGLSAELRQTLNASTVIRPVYADPGQAAALFDEEEATALLTIPAGYEAALLGQQPVDLNLKKVAGDNTVFAIEEAVRAASSQAGSAVSIAHLSTQQAEAIRPFDSPDARQAYFNASLETARERLADPPASTQASQAPEVQVATATGFEQSSPGQLVTWTLITLVGAAEVFVNERLGGTLRRLFVTPTRMVAILTGKITGRLAMGMLQMALLIGFGALFLKVNWGRSPGALALVVLTFGLAAVAFGVMLGTFARTRG
ncbi:MAG: ABC transporter permease, partial [Chloroflexota bacterium]